METRDTGAISPISKPRFLAGVFLIAFSVLVFQIVQTRVLSVIAWYYLAFFAISVAMLGMTIGAVWVYLQRGRFEPAMLSSMLSDHALASAIAMPASLIVQLSLITSLTPTLSTVLCWTLLLSAMAMPYVFAGIVVSLALTRSPFPVSQVYGIDLLGAALGCVAVVLILNLLDGPSTIILAGVFAGVSSWYFASAAPAAQRSALRARPWWRRPAPVALLLVLLTALNAAIPAGIRPIMVKDGLEHAFFKRYEKWNSYSRVVAYPPQNDRITLWGASPRMPAQLKTEFTKLSIDGAAGTTMFHYDGTTESVEYLRYDIVNLAYNLPGLQKAAVIGVGGGRDVLSAHLYGVKQITGVELNRIFIDLHTRHAFFKPFSNLTALPDLQLHVDDARSWFASTPEKFDLIQMSMIDTWAATGAGAYSLSENGLYTLEGWRAFLNALNDDGVFTVSRWYNPGDVNETGRMIGLATAAVLDAGASDARPQLFVARGSNIATLVLSKRRFTAEQLRALRDETERLGFAVLLAPDQPPESELLRGMIAARTLADLDRIGGSAELDLTVPTDNRPFFFNQLRFSRVPAEARRMLSGQMFGGWVSEGVIRGNLIASVTLTLILFISIVAVICTILLPLRGTVRSASTRLIGTGSLYFSLIGAGFMLAEISMLQYFSIFLGHPIYSLGVCLFSLILATGLGSLASGWIDLRTPRAMLIWGLAAAGYLLALPHWLLEVFQATTAQGLPVRIVITLAVVMPFAFLLGFAFPTGMKLVGAVNEEPTPWFWGINGAMGVLASVLAVMLSMAYGINVTLTVAGLCYLALIPTAIALIGMRPKAAAA